MNVCTGAHEFSSPCMERKKKKEPAKLGGYIESRQYAATGAGIGLNSCIVIKLNDGILFSKRRIGFIPSPQSNRLVFLPLRNKSCLAHLQ